MHISKFLAVLCVSALGTTSLLAQRPDNDVQARARQQLREAMGELNGQPVTNAAPTQPVKPMPAPAPAPAQPAVIQPKPVAQPPVTAPAPVVKPMPTTAAPASMSQPKALSPDAEAKARAALHQAEGVQWTPPAPTTTMPAPAMTMTVGGKPAASQPVFTAAPATAPADLAPPAPQLSGTKQQRLDQLLQQYKSEQITPQAYHEQRAKILAEP